MVKLKQRHHWGRHSTVKTSNGMLQKHFSLMESVSFSQLPPRFVALDLHFGQKLKELFLKFL